MRNHVSLALSARNEMAHAIGTIAETNAIFVLRSIQAVAEAMGVTTEVAAKTIAQAPSSIPFGAPCQPHRWRW